MADNDQNPDAYDALRGSAESIARSLFSDVNQGTDLSESLRGLIAQIPDIDANDGNWRWDTLVNDLTNEPEDLAADDLENLQRLMTEFIAGAQTPEHKELAAQIYFQQQFGPRYVVPEGETALGNLELFTLKKTLQNITNTPNAVTGSTAMGIDVDGYRPQHALVSDPLDPQFITTMAQSLAQIQQDMREMGAAPPSAENHGFRAAADSLNDTWILRIADKAMEPLGDNEALQAIRALPTPAERLDGYTAYIEGMDASDADKARYTGALETLRSGQPVLNQLELATSLGMMSEYDYSRYVLADVENIGLERTGSLSGGTQRYLDAYLDYMAQDNGYGTPATRARAQAFAGFMDLYNQLPEDQRQAIETQLSHDSTEAPGIQTAPTPDQPAPLSEEQIAQLPPQQRAAMDVLTYMAETGNTPASVISSITDPQNITGRQYAYLDEAFQQTTQELMQDNMARIYGTPHPHEPGERIGGDAGLMKFWFDGAGQPYDFREQPDGSYTLHQVDQWGNVNNAAVPPEQIPDIFEYHVASDGSISRYLLGNGGQLHESFADLSPVMLEGQFPDFDIRHPNFVTTRFLDRLAQSQWADIRTSAGLQDMAETLPAVNDLDSKLESLETNLADQVKLYYEAQGTDLGNQAIEELIEDIRSTPPTQDSVRQRLGAQNDAQMQSSDAIMNLLLQMQALETVRETAVARDYSRYMDTGVLPRGLGLQVPQSQVEWHVDWDEHFRGGELKWREVQEGRVFPTELNQAYYDALQTGGTVDANLFQNSAYASSYIEEQGWSGGQLDYIQTSMVGRALMLKESADRHGITDPNSAEAREAFVEDFRNGRYHWHDVEMFMRSFDADQQRLNARLEEEGRLASAPNQFDYGASVRHRSEMFNELFGSDVELTDQDGNVLATAENATISRDDAVELFWQSHAQREAFGYDKALYHMGYDELVAEHGQAFADSIEGIMEDRSLYQQFMIMDVNHPQGDQRALYERLFMAHVEDRIETAVKREYDVVPDAAPSPITAATLDPELDVIVEDPAATTEPAEPAEEPAVSSPPDSPQQEGSLEPGTIISPPASSLPFRRTA